MQSFDAQFAQVVDRLLFVGAFKAGEIVFAQFDVDVDRVGDFLAAGDGVFQSREFFIHLLGAAQEELVVLHLHPRCVGAETSGVDAQHDVLCFGIFRIDVVTIAGGDERQSHLFGDVDGAFQLQIAGYRRRCS